jgi:aryl-alcohol dehydrogenase-like predicted oxidoreductase
MEYRNLGASGLKVSAVGLGCDGFGWTTDTEQSRAVVDRALEEEITLFDTGDTYGNRTFGNLGWSEEMLGKALGPRRKDVIVATKFGGLMADSPYMVGTARRYMLMAVESSLRRIGTDYLDLYQIHIPDARTPREETLEAFDDLIRAGKVRCIGAGNYSSWEIVDALWISRMRGLASYVSVQSAYSLLDRHIERELIPACRQFGIGLLPYFPLANGLLTGKYRRGAPLPEGSRLALTNPLAARYLTEASFDILERLEEFARKRGRTLLELALSWVAQQSPVCSVLAGATKPDQVSANVKASGWKLTPEDLFEVNQLTSQNLQDTPFAKGESPVASRRAWFLRSLGS